MTGPTAAAMKVSVVILVKDEEVLLPRCLQQLRWADEVVVVDSGSTDRTVEIAVSHGARVVVQPFLGWPQQRNSGARAAHNDWVLQLDVDEVLDEETRDGVRAVLTAGPNPEDGFSFQRRDEFLGILLPNPQRRRNRGRYVRLYNRTRSSWDETVLVHEYVSVPGATHVVPGRLLHWRPQTLRQSLIRVQRYAEIEAQDLAQSGRRFRAVDLLAKPPLRLLWLLFVRGEIRLGHRGVIHAGLRGFADFWRAAHLFMLEHPHVQEHPPGHGLDPEWGSADVPRARVTGR